MPRAGRCTCCSQGSGQGGGGGLPLSNRIQLRLNLSASNCLKACWLQRVEGAAQWEGCCWWGRQCEGGHEEPSCVGAGRMQVTEAEWGRGNVQRGTRGSGAGVALGCAANVRHPMGYQRRGGAGSKTSKQHTRRGALSGCIGSSEGEGRTREQKAGRQNCPGRAGQRRSRRGAGERVAAREKLQAAGGGWRPSRLRSTQPQGALTRRRRRGTTR